MLEFKHKKSRIGSINYVTGVGVIGKDIALVKALLELSLKEKSVYILFRFSFEVLYTKTPARVGYFPIPYSGPE